MDSITLHDDVGTFEVSILDVRNPARIVLFAVGGGGDPRRHEALLSTLATQGFAVVAPHFERMLSPHPTRELLLLRARRLAMALDTTDQHDAPAVGVGHSIGASTLLALAGGKMWLDRSEPLPIARDSRLERLALLAPATGFFRAPQALCEVHTPMIAWAGALDAITPPSHVELLRDELGGRLSLEVRVVANAGHFTFMHLPPPNTSDSMPAREAFLEELTRQIGDFVRA